MVPFMMLILLIGTTYMRPALSLGIPDMDQREVYNPGNADERNSSPSWSIFPYEDEHPLEPNCGGFLEIKGTADLFHELPFPNNSASSGVNNTCAWVVWASNGGPIRIKLTRNSTVKFDNSFELKVHNVYGSISTSHREFKNTITDMSRNDEVLYRTDDVGGAEGYFPYVIIHFRGQAAKRGQGLHLLLTDLGHGFFHRFRRTTVTMSARAVPSIFMYPRPPASSYGRYERLFMIITPKLNEKIHMELLSIDTERNFDWLMTSYLDSSSEGGVQREMIDERMTNKARQLEADVPLVLIFSSDGRDERRGFRIRYSSIK